MIDYTALTPTVKKAARAAHSSFPAHYDVSDTEQTIWLWVFENKNTVADIIRNTERPEGVLYNLMTKEANQYLKTEDQATYGYSEEDAFTYPLNAVRTALEGVFDYEDWQSFAMNYDGMPRAKGQANMTGDHIAMMVDVKMTVEGLPEDQYNAILWTYKYGYTAEGLAFELGISEEAAKKRLQRAVKAVQRGLGRKDYSDLRKGRMGRSGDPESTAEAASRTERDYSG